MSPGELAERARSENAAQGDIRSLWPRDGAASEGFRVPVGEAALVSLPLRSQCLQLVGASDCFPWNLLLREHLVGFLRSPKLCCTPSCQ